MDDDDHDTVASLSRDASPPNLGVMEDAEANDVLCGRKDTVGNRRFSMLLSLHFPRYAKSASERTAVAASVVHAVTSSGGRFLTWNSHGDEWVNLSNKEAVEWVCRCFQRILLKSRAHSSSACKTGMKKASETETKPQGRIATDNQDPQDSLQSSEDIDSKLAKILLKQHYIFNKLSSEADAQNSPKKRRRKGARA